MTNSQVARVQLYRSKQFRKDLLNKVGSGHAARPALCLDALGGNRPPAIFGRRQFGRAGDGRRNYPLGDRQQTQHASVVCETNRLRELNFQCDVGEKLADDGLTADIMQRLPSMSFAADLASLYVNLWRAVHGKSAWGFRLTAVKMFWSDGRGTALFGVVEQWSTKRRRIYSNVNFPDQVGASWDFVQFPTAGGTSFAPMSILHPGEKLEQGVAGSSAAVAFGER